MRPRNVLLTLALLIIIFLIAVFRHLPNGEPREAFNRSPVKLYYYAIALCRMRCLNIRKADVLAIMQSGVIHLNRSNRYNRPCPIFAVQARTANRKYIRVLFEQCRNASYVVNCYNLEAGPACDCSNEYVPTKH